MAGSLTNYGEGKVLDAVFGGVALGAPATFYLALFTASPTESGSLAAECPNYTRLAVTNNLTNFPAATLGAPTTKSTALQLIFAAVSGSTGTVTHVGLMDAASSGNMWAYFDITTPRAYLIGEIPIVAAGAFTFTAD